MVSLRPARRGARFHILCFFCSIEIDRSAAKNIYTIVYQILQIRPRYDVPSGQISIGTHFFRKLNEKLNRVLSENACARRPPARLSDYHQKVISNVAYGGEH